MATISHHDDLGDEHSVWMHAFDAKTRRQLLDEDRVAGYSVAGILTIIVTLGLLLAIVAVLIATS